MKKIKRKFSVVIVLTSLFLLCTSCSTMQISRSSLYKWYSYSQSTYVYIDDGYSEKSQDKLCKMYEKLISDPSGTRGVVPPGIYADYAYLLLQEGRKEEALTAFDKEMALYPESKIYLLKIIKGLSK